MEAFLNGPTPVAPSAQTRPILYVSDGNGMSRAFAPAPPRAVLTPRPATAKPTAPKPAPLTAQRLLTLLAEKPRSLRELEALYPDDEPVLMSLVAEHLHARLIDRGPAGTSSDAPLHLTTAGRAKVTSPGPSTPGDGPGPREPWRPATSDPSVALVPLPKGDAPEVSPSAYQAWSAEISPKGTRTHLIGGDAALRESQERARIRREHTNPR